METNNINKELDSVKEVDLVDLGKKLLGKRKFILKASIVGAIIGVIIAFSIPKEYTTTIILAPESNSSTGAAGNMNALAAVAGFNLSGTSVDGQISPELYPNIVESTPFITGLFNVCVIDSNNEIGTTLYSYIKNDQKNAWWSQIIKLPGGIIKFFFQKNTYEKIDMVDNSNLTEEQQEVFDNIKNRLTILVEKKTGIIRLEATMQRPEISALIADTLTSYLQAYIINYRTQKARQDLAFTEQLYAEAKKDYSDAQQKYAKYLDENQNIVLASYRLSQEKLQNEMSLAYGVYNQMAQQLQLAKVKVQDRTPVYTIIQPAVVPLYPEKPNKKFIVIAFVFVAIIAGIIWTLRNDLFNYK